MDPREIRNMKSEELVAETRALRHEIFKLRTQTVTEKVPDLSKIRRLRKDVARLLTERTARAAKA
ncbi:MAG: 50S ribosomal protein L29 [Phycisphaerales bacterium]|jgi:large subunit ribosomal protein L29|nr:50S ribosomal protein L29 [Phycisphaerales bacterium]